VRLGRPDLELVGPDASLVREWGDGWSPTLAGCGRVYWGPGLKRGNHHASDGGGCMFGILQFTQEGVGAV